MAMQEKRKTQRFNKQYVVKFALKEDRTRLYDVSQLLDISQGGLRFFAYENYPVGTEMILYIKFPFLYPNETIIEGEVVGFVEVLRGKTYKTRVKFNNLNAQNLVALAQMEHFNRQAPA